MIMCSVRHAGTLLHRARWKGGFAYLLQSTGLDLPPCGCHMLRHTCASLLFSKKLQVEIIASILGHSPEVCRRTYIHFCQEQRAAAIQQIAEFNDI